MAKKTKQNLLEKCESNLRIIKRKRKRRQKTAASLTENEHNIDLRPKKSSILSRIRRRRSIKDNGVNIEVTFPASISDTVKYKEYQKKKMNKDCQKKKENKDCQEKKENKDCQKTKENKDCTTLTIDESVLFKTIDVTGDDDDDDDVVLVNDEEDDVIYIGEDLDAEESIIVIDDDSNIENVTLQNSAATNTSTYVKSRKGGILRQLRWNRSKIANKNNDGVRKCNVPDLSPIPAINNESTNISELPTLVTSTPERNLSVPDYSIPNIIENIANMQITQPLIPMTLHKLSQHMTEFHGMSSNFEIFGSNYVNVGPIRTTGLRPIFIDGSNIAMRHSNGRYFSVEGLKICIDYFKFRGHEVTAIVPTFRKKANQTSNPKLLQRLEEAGTIAFTPSRTINGRHIVPYDDRYIVLLAHVHQGIIVSADNYRDLLQENPSLLDTIENRILTPTWIRDMLIFPTDPMGRNGPRLEEFLSFP